MWERPSRRRKTACYKRNSQSQSERINRCVMTEIGESVRRKCQSDCDGLNLFSMCDKSAWSNKRNTF